MSARESWGIETGEGTREPSVMIPLAGDTWDRVTAQREMDSHVELLRKHGDPGHTYTTRLVRLSARYVLLKTGAGDPVIVAIPAPPTYSLTVTPCALNGTDLHLPPVFEKTGGTRDEMRAELATYLLGLTEGADPAQVEMRQYRTPDRWLVTLDDGEVVRCIAEITADADTDTDTDTEPGAPEELLQQTRDHVAAAGLADVFDVGAGDSPGHNPVGTYRLGAWEITFGLSNDDRAEWIVDARIGDATRPDRFLYRTLDSDNVPAGLAAAVELMAEDGAGADLVAAGWCDLIS